MKSGRTIVATDRAAKVRRGQGSGEIRVSTHYEKTIEYIKINSKIEWCSMKKKKLAI